MPRLSPVVKNLLLLNIIFFAVVYLDGQLGISAYGSGRGYFGLGEMLALHYPESPKFLPVQIVTHFFMHGSLAHIFFNMFALVMFGPLLESMWGHKKFLFFYFACALGSAALHMTYFWWDMSQMQDAINAYAANPSVAILNDYLPGDYLRNISLTGGGTASSYAATIKAALANGQMEYATQSGVNLMEIWYEIKRDIPMVGASGAIYGLLLAFAMYFPDFELRPIFFPVGLKARYFIPILIVIEIFLGFKQYDWDNIAHFAHLGGALIGFLIILYWRKTGKSTGQRWD